MDCSYNPSTWRMLRRKLPSQSKSGALRMEDPSLLLVRMLTSGLNMQPQGSDERLHLYL